MHLEGALSPSLLFTLASRNNITLPVDDPAFSSADALLNRYTHFSSLDDFLQYYYVGMSCLIHEQDFEQLAWEYFIRAKRDGVVHAEVFFDPQAHTGRGVQYQVIVNGFEKACKKAETELGISTKLILCFLRHLSVPESTAMFLQAQQDLVSGRLAGIGLDSSEKGNPPVRWKPVFDMAKSQNIKRTAHAGEEGPVEYIREAFRELDIERVDHGIRLTDDEALMQEVADRKYLVTLCPLSNVQLRCVKGIEELPIRTFLEHGVNFSLNSDDPAYFGGYILDNYCAVQEVFDLTFRDWETIAAAAIKGSWCENSRKDALLLQLDETMQHFTNG
ncbi:adenine deaminase [Puttea exsequens]|nr:adenine deaminase [Puttea exsequens]